MRPAGRSWVKEMTQLIKEIDSRHPVTTGLHTANLFADNGLRVDHVFDESDVAVMHGYPMYVDWARDPLDPAFVPYLCALVTALTGKPCLAEEWGGCTITKHRRFHHLGLDRIRVRRGPNSWPGRRHSPGMSSRSCRG